MPKSKQNNHEYYANYETSRNRLFDNFAPTKLQNEDFHLDVSFDEPQKCRGKRKRKNKHV